MKKTLWISALVAQLAMAEGGVMFVDVTSSAMFGSSTPHTQGFAIGAKMENYYFKLGQEAYTSSKTPILALAKDEATFGGWSYVELGSTFEMGTTQAQGTFAAGMNGERSIAGLTQNTTPAQPEVEDKRAYLATLHNLFVAQNMVESDVTSLCPYTKIAFGTHERFGELGFAFNTQMEESNLYANGGARYIYKNAFAQGDNPVGAQEANNFVNTATAGFKTKIDDLYSLKVEGTFQTPETDAQESGRRYMTIGIETAF